MRAMPILKIFIFTKNSINITGDTINCKNFVQITKPRSNAEEPSDNYPVTSFDVVNQCNVCVVLICCF